MTPEHKPHQTTSSVFDKLLDRAIKAAWDDITEFQDRERERCATGRPHGPVGTPLDIVLYGCRCQRHRAPKDFVGLQGFLDGPALKAEVMWYGPLTSWQRDRVARLTDISEA